MECCYIDRGYPDFYSAHKEIAEVIELNIMLPEMIVCFQPLLQEQ